jgi:hypothetical protein
MRISNWLVVAGLAVVAAAAPGCRTESSTSGDLATKTTSDREKKSTGGKSTIYSKVSPYPGIVEIYRSAALVGYVSIDAVDPAISWWYLDPLERVPVMPYTTTDDVVWQWNSMEMLTAQQICAVHRPELAGWRLWRVDSVGATCE